jgi:hypothetical protein
MLKNIFPPSLTLQQNKLGCSSLARFSRLVCYLRAYQSGSPLGGSLCMSFSHISDYPKEKLVRVEHSSLFCFSVSYKSKSFIGLKPELFPEGAVDKQVDGRVEGHEQVGK